MYQPQPQQQQQQDDNTQASNATYQYQDYTQLGTSYNLLQPNNSYENINYYTYGYQNYTYPYTQTSSFQQSSCQDQDAYYWLRLQNNKTPEKVVMNDSGIATTPEVEKPCSKDNENTNDSVTELEQETPSTSSQKQSLEDKNSILKPPKPYLEIIADAILSSENRMMQLHEIYYFMEKKYDYFSHNINKSWRNSVRHNLSLNECFMKAGRGTNGKGNYWKIHPLCEAEFVRGNFRRKNFKKLIRQGTASMRQKAQQQQQALNENQAPFSLISNQPLSSLSFNLSNYQLNNAAYSNLLSNAAYGSTSTSSRFHPYNTY